MAIGRWSARLSVGVTMVMRISAAALGQHDHGILKMAHEEIGKAILERKQPAQHPLTDRVIWHEPLLPERIERAPREQPHVGDILEAPPPRDRVRVEIEIG